MKKMNFSCGNLGKSWINFQRMKIIIFGEGLIMQDELTALAVELQKYRKP